MCIVTSNLMSIIIALLLGMPGGLGSLSPARTACDVAPMTDEAIAVSLESAHIRAAPLGRGDDLQDAAALAAFSVPEGFPVNPVSIAEIKELELEFAACYNAGELRRAAALLTGDAQADFLAAAKADSTSQAGSQLTSASPLPEAEQIPFIRVSDVRLLFDGRLRALVFREFGPDDSDSSLLTYHVYELVDCDWRVMKEIPVH